MVAAVFESLTSDDNQKLALDASVNKSSEISIDERILNAKTVSGLLSVGEINGPLNRKHALKIVSILAEWSSINRVKLSDFENDTRFIKMCRLLGRSVPKNNNNGPNNQSAKVKNQLDDLNTVLGIAGDDEAAKLVASISLPQMVKVMSTLAQKKRRSTPLLRSLAFNISSSSEPLDLKQCADLLYAMASLNFPDSVLTAKICADIQTGLPNNVEKSAVVGSIIRSLGILRYRDLDLMELLSDWILKHIDLCRPQDVASLFLTMATVNFHSQNIEEIKAKVLITLVREDFLKPSDWLNHVWALTVLGLSNSKDLETVLSEEFIEKLQTDKKVLTPNVQIKLLNINAFAKNVSEYKGPLLDENSPDFSVQLSYNKSKQALLNSMLDALKSLIPSATYVKSLVDTKMGFLIDAHCILDSRRNPLPIDKEHTDATKIAFMVVDYHDTCQGTHRSLSGVTKYSFDLLEKRGYKVLPVPYNEFSTSEKVLKRVQYLEAKLKSIVKQTK